MSAKLTIAAVAFLLLAVLVSRRFSASARETNQASDTTRRHAANKSPAYSASGYSLAPLTQARINELGMDLSSEQRRVLLEEGTERAFTGSLVSNKKKGIYVCHLCGLPLYASAAKFESGTGWPSFFEPIDPDHVGEVRDKQFGTERTEIECARCRSHLGHVFGDGPRPTGLRYCMNSAALKFYESGADLPAESLRAETALAYFAGGCFWGIEDRFQQVPGVIGAVSGYQGGDVANPAYEQVCRGHTGHAESVRVTFDPGKVSYQKLLEWFFEFHDPTQINRQGPDVGSQYRSAIFAADDRQLEESKVFVAKQQSTARFRGRKIATAVERAGTFYEAEEYHQDYLARNGGSCSIGSGK